MDEKLKEAIFHTALIINHGHKHGGYTLGMEHAVDYLVEIAMEEDQVEGDEVFIECLASFLMHLHMVNTPPDAVEALLEIIKEYMSANEVPYERIERLYDSSNKRLDYIYGQLQPVPSRPNGYFLKDGREVDGEVFLGLHGVQFIEDVSAMTQESIDAMTSGGGEFIH